MSDAAIIIITDIIWTLIGIIGVYYSVREIRYAARGVRYYEETGRRAFGRRMNRTALFHVTAVTIAVCLGFLVIGTDLHDWYSGVELEISPRRTLFRIILEAKFGCVVLAMREQDRIRELFGEESGDDADGG